MALAIYVDLAGRHYWAEPTSAHTVRRLASGEWTLFDATPGTPPPPGDPFAAKMAAVAADPASAFAAAQRQVFDAWLAASGVVPPTGSRPVFATVDQALADANPASTWIVLTSDATPPAVPTGLTATAGNRQVTWDWGDNGESDMSGYQYRIGTTNPPTGAAADVAASTVTVSGLTNGLAYYVQVRAVDTSGNMSGWSAAVAATPTSFVDLAQHAIGRATSATSITTTLDAAPTAGNLLVARLGADGANADQQTPSGWVKAGSVGGSTSGSIGMYYRVAQAGDPASWTFTVVNAAELDLGIDEWTGDLTALDVVASGSSGSNVTTATLGPTTATATQPELAIAAVHTKAVSGGFGNTWTGGFTQIGANSNQDAAYKALTAAGDTPSTAETWTTARPAAWMLATFRK